MPSVFLSGIGLAVATGLNASLPLLVLALADRVSESIDLAGPFDFLSSNAGILLLLLVLPIELVADKVPRLDHVNDLLHTALRPLAGATSFLAIADQEDKLALWLAGAFGLVIAGLVHAWKMRTRPTITRATMGLGNPYASMVEDFVAIAISVVAVSLPWGVPVAIVAGLALVRRTYTRLVSGTSRVVRLFMPKT